MKKKNKIIIGTVVGVVVLAITLTVILTGETPGLTEDPTPSNSESPSDVVVVPPTNKPADPTDTPSPTEENPELILDVGGNPDPKDNNGNSTPNPTVKPAEKPIDVKKPDIPDNNDNNGGVVIGGDQEHDHEAYNCGVSNHKCGNPEAHAYIANLEIEGCSTCSSHSCPSFYALDEWGKTIYTPSKCPKYDIKKDPVYYCQICGKKVGSGSPDKCVQFVNDCNCPTCGEYVPAWTCHSCK